MVVYLGVLVRLLTVGIRPISNFFASFLEPFPQWIILSILDMRYTSSHNLLCYVCLKSLVGDRDCTFLEMNGRRVDLVNRGGQKEGLREEERGYYGWDEMHERRINKSIHE